MLPKHKLYYLLSIAVITFIASCKKYDQVTPGANKHSDAYGTYLYESNSWYLTREGSGGTVHVKFQGHTDADSLKILVSGDGLISDRKIALSDNKSFIGDIPVSFSVSSVPTGTFTRSTILKAYQGTDVLTVTLQSGNLSYQ